MAPPIATYMRHQPQLEYQFISFGRHDEWLPQELQEFWLLVCLFEGILVTGMLRLHSTEHKDRFSLYSERQIDNIYSQSRNKLTELVVRVAILAHALFLG